MFILTIAAAKFQQVAGFLCIPWIYIVYCSMYPSLHDTTLVIIIETAIMQGHTRLQFI